MIDYYGVTFDHLVPPDDTNPEVLQINIVEIEDDAGVYANKYNPFEIDPKEYIGKKVLAVPRCCQKRKGTTDRMRVNDAVIRREGRLVNDEFDPLYVYFHVTSSFGPIKAAIEVGPRLLGQISYFPLPHYIHSHYSHRASLSRNLDRRRQNHPTNPIKPAEMSGIS